MQALVEIKALGVETFLPLWLPPPAPAPAKARGADGVLEPAFPGYLFVRFSRMGQAWRRIPECRAVYRLMSQDAEHPTPVRQAEIDRMMRRYGEGGELTVASGRTEWQPLAKGTCLTVEDGPFTSFPAVLLEDGGARLRVRITIFGRSTECEMPRAAVSVGGR